MKTCTKCNQSHPPEAYEFRWDTRTYRGVCIFCRRAEKRVVQPSAFVQVEGGFLPMGPVDERRALVWGVELRRAA